MKVRCAVCYPPHRPLTVALCFATLGAHYVLQWLRKLAVDVNVLFPKMHIQNLIIHGRHITHRMPVASERQTSPGLFVGRLRKVSAE